MGKYLVLSFAYTILLLWMLMFSSSLAISSRGRSLKSKVKGRKLNTPNDVHGNLPETKDLTVVEEPHRNYPSPRKYVGAKEEEQDVVSSRKGHASDCPEVRSGATTGKSAAAARNGCGKSRSGVPNRQYPPMTESAARSAGKATSCNNGRSRLAGTGTGKSNGKSSGSRRQRQRRLKGKGKRSSKDAADSRAACEEEETSGEQREYPPPTKEETSLQEEEKVDVNEEDEDDKNEKEDPKEDQNEEEDTSSTMTDGMTETKTQASAVAADGSKKAGVSMGVLGFVLLALAALKVVFARKRREGKAIYDDFDKGDETFVYPSEEELVGPEFDLDFAEDQPPLSRTNAFRFGGASDDVSVAQSTRSYDMRSIATSNVARGNVVAKCVLLCCEAH